MREKGLGTPATRAQTIEGLIAEKYMLRDGRELVPTAKAFQLMTLLRGLAIEDLTKPELTGNWEYQLAEMEHGRLSRDDLHGRDREDGRAHRQEGQGIRPRHHPRRLRDAGHALPQLRRRRQGELPPLRLHRRRRQRRKAAASRSPRSRPAAPSRPPRPKPSCATSRSARWKASARRRASRSPPSSSWCYDDEIAQLEARVRLRRRRQERRRRRRAGRLLASRAWAPARSARATSTNTAATTSANTRSARMSPATSRPARSSCSSR